MNKLMKIILAILGGIEATFSLLLPLLILGVVLSTEISNLSRILYSTLCIGATLFRAIRIGWLRGNKQDD